MSNLKNILSGEAAAFVMMASAVAFMIWFMVVLTIVNPEGWDMVEVEEAPQNWESMYEDSGVHRYPTGLLDIQSRSYKEVRHRIVFDVDTIATLNGDRLSERHSKELFHLFMYTITQ